MRLPGLHSIHWKVFVFHLAVLVPPVGYLAWQLRQGLEATHLQATEEGMIDTAAMAGDLYAQLDRETGGGGGNVTTPYAELRVGALRGVNLHPMNYFFLAAGLFAFQLLFAYLVDLIPIGVAFGIAAAVSLALVGGYLRAAAGAGFARIALAAQFAYLVLFSYSFFFDGLTGLTITVGSIVTLALLMTLTARVNRGARFAGTPAAAATPVVA